MSYGTRWGTNWGGCDPDSGDITPPLESGFFVASARANTSKTFIVQFSVRPLAASPIGANDVLNLSNVTLTNCETLEELPILVIGTVLGSLTCMEFFLLGSFDTAEMQFEVCFTSLVGHMSEPFIDPMCAKFGGMPSDQLPRETLRPLLDYHNPQTSGELINGGLVVGSNADYELEGGVQLIRKLITRRVITAQNEFFHLSDRRYGLGVQPKLLYTAADLIQFKRQLDAEVRKEPEIDRAKSQVTLTPDHILTITVQAILRATGQQIAISVPLDLTSTTTVIS